MMGIDGTLIVVRMIGCAAGLTHSAEEAEKRLSMLTVREISRSRIAPEEELQGCKAAPWRHHP